MAKRAKRPAQPLADLRRRADEEARMRGLELVDVVMARESVGSVLRFTIDRAAGGITLDDCEGFHRQALKFAQDLEYDYMEVTSPGADRPLKTERDFESALWQRVEVRFYRQIEGAKQLTGQLVAWDDDNITLDIDGTQHCLKRADVSQIKMALDETELDSPLFEEMERAEAEAERENDNLNDGGDF